MATRRRTKRKRSYRPRQVSLLASLETLSLLAIMSKGLTGYGPWEFLTQDSDIGGMQ